MADSDDAVIFTEAQRRRWRGVRSDGKPMVELAREQLGFRGVESVRGADGVGITVSYWDGAEDIRAWKLHAEHLVAQETGRARWYESFTTRICRVEREYSFEA